MSRASIPASSRLKFPAATLGLLALLTGVGHAASSTWVASGTTSGLWSNADNWNFNGVPGATSGVTSSDIATFNASLGSFGTAASPVLIDAGRNISGIQFTATPGNYVIGTTTGPALTLSSGGSIQILNTTTSTTSALRIDAPLLMATGSYSLINNSVQAGNSLTFNGTISALGVGEHTLTLGNIVQFGVTSTAANNNNTINGVISNGEASSLQVIKTGLSNWTFTANNTYTGATTVRGGITNTNGQLGNLRLGGLDGKISRTSSLSVSGLGTVLNGDGTGNATLNLNNGVANRINPSASLSLGNATFGGGAYTQIAPLAGFTHAQSLASLYADVGSHTVNAGGTAAATALNTLTFTGASPYTRGIGSFVNFGTAAGFSINFTNAPSGPIISGTGADAILVGSALGSTNFVAVPAAGAPLGNATYVTTPTWTEGKNMDVVGSPSLSASLAVNSLRINAASAQTITLSDGVTLNLSSGGLLNGTGKGANATTITGGTITGSASGELSVANFSGNNLFIASSIANNGGPTALTRVGAGTVILSGNNTYSGGTYLNQGTLQLRSGSALGTGPLRIQGHSSQLNLSNAINAAGFTVPNDIIINYAAGVGSAGLIHAGTAGLFTFNGTLTVNNLPVNGGLFGGAGATSIMELAGPIIAPFGIGGRNGTIRISGTPTSKAASSYPSVFNNGSIIQVGAENGILNSATLDNNQGAGGTLDLNGFNQELAGLTNSGATGGTVQNGVVGAVKTLTLNIGEGRTFTTNAALGGTVVANQPGLAITKTGLGTQILNSNSTYTGPTLVSGGRLVIGSTANSTAAILAAGSSVTVESGATLSGTGTINGPVSIQGGGSLQPGHTSLNPLTLNGSSVTLAGGSNINFGTLSRTGAGTISNELRVTSTDALALPGSTGSVQVQGDITALTTGVYSLIDYTGAIGGTGFTALTPAFTTGPRLAAQLQNNTADGRVELVVTGDTPRWTGAGSSAWSTAVLPTKNWALVNGGTPTDYVQADVVLFDDSAANTVVDISAADVSPNGVTFDNSSKNYTLQGSRGISGAVSIVKSGSGSLTISNPNANTGGLTLNAGTVQLSSGGKLGATTAPVVLNAGLLDLGGTTQYVGNVTIVAPAAVQNGTLLGTAYTVNTSAADTTVSGLSGPSVNLTKTGAGTLTIGSGNTYTGTTTVSEGTLRLGAANAVSPLTRLTVGTLATLDLNGFDLTVDGLNAPSAASLITSNAEGTGTDTLTSLFTTAGIGALVQDGPTRKVRLAIANLNSDFGPINTANTYSGGTVFLGQQGANTAGARVTPKAGTTADVADGVVTNIVSGPYGRGPITMGLSPTDRVQLYFNATTAFLPFYNDLIINSEVGTDTGGVLRVESEGGGFYGKIIANQTNVSFRANNQLGGIPEANTTIYGQISTGVNPAAGLRLMAPGFTYTVNLSNTSAFPNNYTGNTTIEGGRLRLQAAEQIPHGTGSGSVSMTGGIFDLNGYSETVNALAGSGGAIDATTGTSTLTIGNGDASGSFAGVLRNTGGSLSLVKVGSGAQTLSGNNAYSGTTTLQGGSLVIARAAGAIPDASAVTISNNATLNIGSSAETIGALSLSSGSILGTTGVLTASAYELQGGVVSAALGGSSGLVKSGSAQLVLGGASSYAGPTTINAGSLLVNGNQSAATGTIAVNAGATLGGSGTVGGAVVVANGAFLAPGGSAPGVFTAPAVSLASGSTFAVDVQTDLATPANDSLAVAGTLDVTGSNLSINLTGTPTAAAYVLANYGSLVGTFAQVTGVPSGYTLNYAYETNKIALVKNVVETPYSTWIGGFSGLTTEQRAGTADPDGDGANNFAEFALAGDPVSGAVQGQLYPKTVTLAGSPAFTATLAVRSGAVFAGATEQVSGTVDGVVYRVQASADLSAWTTLAVSEVTGSDATAIQTGLPGLATGWTYRTFRVVGAVPNPGRLFIRAVVQ